MDRVSTSGTAGAAAVKSRNISNRSNWQGKIFEEREFCCRNREFKQVRSLLLSFWTFPAPKLLCPWTSETVHNGSNLRIEGVTFRTRLVRHA